MGGAVEVGKEEEEGADGATIGGGDAANVGDLAEEEEAECEGNPTRGAGRDILPFRCRFPTLGRELGLASVRFGMSGRNYYDNEVIREPFSSRSVHLLPMHMQTRTVFISFCV